jgi:hypothetical protein
MPKKKLRLSKKKQSERFVKKARELCADGNGREFGRALDIVMAPKMAKPRSAD